MTCRRQVSSQQLAGAVRRAHERRRDDLQAESGAALLVGRELRGLDVARHRQADGVGLQVLADGHGVDAGGGAVGEHLLDLRRALAEPDHETALDQRPGAGGSFGEVALAPPGAPEIEAKAASRAQAAARRRSRSERS